MFKTKPNKKQGVIIGVIAGIIALCGIAIAIYRMAVSPQTSLPEVPTFAYSTLTPTVTSAATTMVPVTVTGTITPVTATKSPTPTSTGQVFAILQWPTSRPPSSAVRTNTPNIISVIIPSSTPPPGVTIIPQSPPTNTPTVTATTISTVRNCYNILYPAKAGQVWNYQVNANSRSGEVRMTVVSVDGSTGTVDVFNQSRGATGRGFIQCDGDVIFNFPSVSAEMLLGNVLDGGMQVEYISGVLAPNETAFKNTNWALAWSSQYLVSGNGSITYNGNNFDLVLNPSVIVMTCQTLASGEAAFETVTVPAGTFKALKVVCIGQGQGTGTVNGGAITGWISAQSTQWFVPYLGLVKMQSDYANIDVFGITIPLGSGGLSGRVELNSFVQAP